MKTAITTIITFFFALTLQAQDTIKLSDFNNLNNTSWTGTLTYKDYQSGKQQTIDSKMQIHIENGKVKTSIQYVYEPSKNYTSNVKIKKNGTYYGSQKIESNTYENGTRTIVTTYKGRDNNKKATMFITYKFNDANFSTTKEVVFDGTTERFIRNTYVFTKL